MIKVMFKNEQVSYTLKEANTYTFRTKCWIFQAFWV